MRRAIFGIIVVLLFVMFYAGVVLILTSNRPPITILSENVYPDLSTGGNMLIVEYAIAGHAYSVTFRGDQEENYIRFKNHLASVGRIK
jgi:hypothetical protein